METNFTNLYSYQLQNLPDEIILRIFNLLNKKDLSQVAKASKRTLAIAKDFSLWQRVSFWRKKVTTSFLQEVINRGCKFLSLHNAELEGSLNFSNNSELITLDISDCKANEGVLEELVGSCHSLEKFAMMDLVAGSLMLRNICEQNGTTLKALNMGQCRGLPLNSINLITNNCIGLTSLNLRNVQISENAVNDLMELLNPNIVSLSFGFRNLVKDIHVETLLKRCKKIRHLGLKSFSISNLVITHIVDHAKETLVSLFLEVRHIYCSKLRDLRRMRKLKSLFCGGLKYNGGRHEEIQRLHNLLPNVRIRHPN